MTRVMQDSLTMLAGRAQVSDEPHVWIRRTAELLRCSTNYPMEGLEWCRADRLHACIGPQVQHLQDALCLDHETFQKGLGYPVSGIELLATSSDDYRDSATHICQALWNIHGQPSADRAI
ncbi:unnamed protein product, partial [Symbiodinium pilosum]